MANGAWLYAFLALAVSARICGAAEPVILRFTLEVPVSNAEFGLGVLQFKEEVEKKSQGAVRVEIFDGGKVYTDEQTVGAVASGEIDMGLAGNNQISRWLPAADIMEQPFLFNFEALTHAAVSPESELRKLLDQSVLETIGVRVLWWQAAGPVVLFSKGDVADPDRIRDKKVHVHSVTALSLVDRCGGTPRVISTTKIHDALKDGTVDVVMSSPRGVESHELWKVADTITRTEHARIELVAMVNEKTWQGLTDRQRTIILAAAKRAERDARQRASNFEKKAYELARSKGMKVLELTPDQVVKWRACSADVVVTYMSGGGEQVQKLLAAYAKLRTDPCCSAGPDGTQ
jgi:C4-dicarboxylate-binding protein DctP